MKMTTTYKLLTALMVTLTIGAFWYASSPRQESNIQDTASNALRERYKDYLENHPFRQTMALSKEERRSVGLPPNKYYEQEWLYSSDPTLMRPAPERVHELQQVLKSNPYMLTPPGTGSNVWVERGPNNVGGRTHSLMFAPGSTTKVFAGGVSGGLWVNNNITSASSQWQQVSGVPGNMAVMCMTVDPNDPNTMYIGTGEVYTWGAVNGNGVYKSTDGGVTWNLLFSGGSTPEDKIVYVQDIVAWNNPTTNQTEIFFGADSMAYTEEIVSGSGGAGWTWLGANTIGLYHSIDGTNFTRLTDAVLQSSTNTYFAPNDFDIGADGTLWMGTKYSYYTGEGGGRVFKNTGTGWSLVRDLGDNGRVELACSQQSATKIYALCEDRTSTTNPVKIYRTTNGFSTNPTSLPQPNDADTGISANDFTRGQSFYDLMIGVDPLNDAIVYVGGIDLFKSTNSGGGWTQQSHWYGGFGFQEVHADQHGIAFAPATGGSTSRVIFGNDGGVYYTNNAGGNIYARNNGYNVTQFYKGAINQETSVDKLLAGAQDNGSQLINNAPAGIGSSNEVTGGDGCYVFIDQDNQYMISSYVYNSYYRLSYSTGSQVGTIASNTSDGDFVNQCALDSQANLLYANGSNGTNYRIYRYNALASGATTLSNGMLDAMPTAFVASPYTNNRILVGTALGKIIKLDNANLFPSWTDISMPGQVGAVSDIRYGATENEIMVTFHNYGVNNIWYTADGGNNWVSKEGNLPDLPVKCILQNPLSPNEVIIGTELGVWQTSNWNDANPSWTQSQNGMSDVKVTSFDYRSADNTIIASTYGRGMFTGTFQSTPTGPSIGFDTTFATTTEGSECNFTEITVTLSIGQAPSQDADVTFSINPTTSAAEGQDFDLITNSVTFPAGSTSSQSMTLRIYEDDFIEGDESILIDLSVNANGGNATSESGFETYTLNIVNDDFAPVASEDFVIASYDMQTLTGWQSIDNDGDGRYWISLIGITWPGISGTFLGSETNLSITGGGPNADADNLLISPPINVSSGATNVEFSFGVGGYLTQEHYAVYWTTDISSVAAITSGILLEERNSLSNNSEIRTINNTTLAGQTGYFVIRHYNSSTNDGVLFFDTLNVTETLTTAVQTAVNTGVPDQTNLYGAGTIYSNDPNSGDRMMDVTNNDGFDYGCVSLSVSRAGTGAQSYGSSALPYHVTDKRYTLTSANTTSTGDVSVTFYFEEAEIAGWESATGLSRNDLVIAREVSSTLVETPAATIGAFGTHVTLTANFVGLEGDYYFGPIEAFVACAGVAKTWNGNSWTPGGAPSSINTVTINGDYDTSTDGSFEACTVTVNAGNTLTITANEYMRIQGNIIVEGTLVVEHQGSVVQLNDNAIVTNNGVINVNLTTPDLASRDFMILGSPMSGETRNDVWASAFLVLDHTTANFVPNPDVEAALPGAENFADDNYDNWNAYTGAIVPGEGYIVRPQAGFGQPGGIFNYTYDTGTLNNGIVNFPIVYNTPGPTDADNRNASPNVLANPYPSAIHADDFINANAMVEEVYFWEHLTPPDPGIPGAGAMNFDMQDISMYNLMGGTPAANDVSPFPTTPNGVISTGQGFGIKATQGGTAIFNNAMRRNTGNTTLNGPVTFEKDRLWLQLDQSEHELQSVALIGFSDHTTAGLDSGYDSRRLATVLSLFSHLEDGSQQLGIQSREALDQDMEVPLGFSSMLQGYFQYKITLEAFEGQNLESSEIYLLDNQTGTITNLKEDSYAFTSNPGNFYERFTVLFRMNPLLDVPGLDQNTVAIYPNPTSDNLNLVTNNSLVEQIEIFDLLGKKIYSKKVNDTRLTVDVSEWQSAVYIIQLETEKGTVVERFVKE